MSGIGIPAAIALLVAMVSQAPASAGNSLLLLEPVQATLVRADTESIDERGAPSSISAWFRVRFRVLSVLAGEFRNGEIERMVLAHDEGDIIGIPQWSLLLPDESSGQESELRPLIRMVCVASGAENSSLLGRFEWVRVVGREAGDRPFGDVVCTALQEYRDELR